MSTPAPLHQAALFAVLVGLALTPGAAQAGNHLLLELDGAASTPVGLGAEVETGGAIGGTFGVGGRFRGHAPAYYLVVRSGWGADAVVGPGRLGAARLERGVFELGAGGRVYIPLTQRLRLHIEGLVGRTWLDEQVTRDGHRAFDAVDERFTLFGGAGLQLRVLPHLSVGARADISWMPGTGDPNLAHIAAGLPAEDDGQGRVRLGLMTTFHF